jgi:hypothetical protein
VVDEAGSVVAEAVAMDHPEVTEETEATSVEDVATEADVAAVVMALSEALPVAVHETTPALVLPSTLRIRAPSPASDHRSQPPQNPLSDVHGGAYEYFTIRLLSSFSMANDIERAKILCDGLSGLGWKFF